MYRIGASRVCLGHGLKGYSLYEGNLKGALCLVVDLIVVAVLAHQPDSARDQPTPWGRDQEQDLGGRGPSVIICSFRLAGTWLFLRESSARPAARALRCPSSWSSSWRPPQGLLLLRLL